MLMEVCQMLDRPLQVRRMGNWVIPRDLVPTENWDDLENAS